MDKCGTDSILDRSFPTCFPFSFRIVNFQSLSRHLVQPARSFCTFEIQDLENMMVFIQVHRIFKGNLPTRKEYPSSKVNALYSNHHQAVSRKFWGSLLISEAAEPLQEALLCLLPRLSTIWSTWLKWHLSLGRVKTSLWLKPWGGTASTPRPKGFQISRKTA